MASEPQRQQLPIPDHDHLPIGSLQHRIRTLEENQLDELAEYERRHASRAPVLALIEARQEALRAGSEPSPGSSSGRQPEAPPGPAGGSPVSPQTAGPPMNPPSHGVPSNPAQPRSTG